jgi:chromate reductase
MNSTKPKTGVFIGSLRKESFTKKIARELERLASDKFDFTEMEMGNLPMYNQDLDDEGKAPSEWIHFRESVQKLDAVLFVTPEYNRSVPPLLKNAIDIASRPMGKNVWNGKPAAVVGVSPGALGGFGVVQQLRQMFTVLNIPAMQQPEAYIGNAAALLDESGKIQNEKTRAFLASVMDAYLEWVKTLSSK